jgi:hypothetical protein
MRDPTMFESRAILLDAMPPDLDPAAGLPGVQPLADGRWLCRDETYAAQMAYRRHLLATRRDRVLWQDAHAGESVGELFREVLHLLPSLGHEVTGDRILCPDGVAVEIASDIPLAVLGQVVQEDLCLMEKRGAEHVLTAAVLCFPASWSLAEKAGRPLTGIHRPVAAYNVPLAQRVQRLFDGVQVGRPLWRNNMLRYADPDLHQPAREVDPPRRKPGPDERAYLRAERQCIARLPNSRAVVFSIHSYVVREG